MPSPPNVTEMLIKWKNGDQGVLEKLILWYTMSCAARLLVISNENVADTLFRLRR